MTDADLRAVLESEPGPEVEHGRPTHRPEPNTTHRHRCGRDPTCYRNP